MPANNSTNADAAPSFKDRLFGSLNAVPRIPEPGAFSYVPVVGPAWEAAADLQHGDYMGALFNAAMTAADLSPIAPIRKTLQLVKGIDDMRRGAFLAQYGTQLKRMRKVMDVAKGDAVHHVVPMKGGVGGLIPKASKNAEGVWRNHPANMKVLSKELHNKVHTSFGNPLTDPFLKAWHGTNALQKTGVAAVGAIAADTAQNGLRSSSPADPVPIAPVDPSRRR